MPVLPIPRSSPATFPTSICSIRICRPSACWKSVRERAESAALAVKGVTKSGGASASAGIGGMVLVTSHGFRGAYLGSRAERIDDGDRRRRHRHGARLRLLLRAARRRSRFAREGRAHRRRARGRAAQSAQGRDQARAGGVRPARGGLARRSSGRRDQRRRHRAQDQLPQGQARRAAVHGRHRHHRRSAAPQARLALASVRRRGRRDQAARR